MWTGKWRKAMRIRLKGRSAIFMYEVLKYEQARSSLHMGSSLWIGLSAYLLNNFLIELVLLSLHHVYILSRCCVFLKAHHWKCWTDPLMLWLGVYLSYSIVHLRIKWFVNLTPRPNSIILNLPFILCLTVHQLDLKRPGCLLSVFDYIILSQGFGCLTSLFD